MDDAAELIELFASIELRMEIISNGADSSRRATLRSLPFACHFSSIVSSERVGLSKPDPQIFQTAAAELEVAVESCWYVGDHPINDIVGARNAGMKNIWLKGFHDWPQGISAPEYAVARMSEAASIILDENC